MRKQLLILCLVVVAFGLLVSACGGDGSAAEDDENTLRIVAQDGKTVRLQIEVADEASELTTGLMSRPELAKDAGMLFILNGSRRGFWMKDTLIPLSVAFIGDCGRILAIADMEPQSERIHNTTEPYFFGLEVNQGWFARNGLGIGSQVPIPEAYLRSNCR